MVITSLFEFCSLAVAYFLVDIGSPFIKEVNKYSVSSFFIGAILDVAT